MLKVDVLNKSYGQHRVLGHCTLHMKAGERISILGPSGCGKSTLLRIIAGLDKEFDGLVNRPSTTTLMFQEPNLLAWRNCYQNLQIFNPTATQQEVQSALSQVGLTDKGELYPRQLSLGQQRRLALARTFLTNTDLVLLDEPFTSLDPSLKIDMLHLTRDLLNHSGACLVHVTHDATEAEALGAKIVQMHNTPSQLFVN